MSGRRADSAETMTRTVAGNFLRFHQLFTFAIGFLLGFGWVVMTGTWIKGAGPGGAALAFLVGGLMLIPIALCYVEVGSRYPHAGGEFVYAYSAFGVGAAFFTGWLLLLLFISLTAFEIVAAAWIVTIIVPSWTGPGLYEVAGFPISLGMLILMVAGVLCVSWVNFRGSASMAKAQDCTTYVLIALAVLIIAGGFAGGETRHLVPLVSAPQPGWAYYGVLGVFATTPIWYCGLNALPQALSELDTKPSPARLARLVVYILVGSALFYFLLILSTGMAAPREVLIKSEFATATAAQWAYGMRAAAQMVLVAGLLGVVTTWNAAHYAAAQILFALGRARLLPEAFSRKHPRYGSAYVGIVFVAIVGMLGALGGVSMIGIIVNAGVLIAATLFFITCLSLFRLRGDDVGDPDHYRVPGYPWLPGLALAYAVCTIVFGLLVTWQARLPGRIPAEWLVLAGWGALGMLLWWRGRASREALGEDTRARLIHGEELT